ncbi:MAG: hypothetical protein LQ348_004160 [Seirophora lacunosa]|nr:MAG: hypothetical protein LQ348_004160 [Seirophora lacunosa]
MSQLLRRKLVCFYCNRRSAQDRKLGIRQWQCERCDAVNYLDEDGEITDPPVKATSPSTYYAQPRPQYASTKSPFPERSLFCQRCLQNQHIVNQALAEYLPSQDDPSYSEFEKSLPGYRRTMEARFPQVCEKCAPAVEDRIRSTGYAAKTDHLRRMMDRTRGAGVLHKSWDSKQLIASLGAAGWSIGLLGQALWHTLGTLPTRHEDRGLLHEEEPPSISTCLTYGASRFQSTPFCSNILQPLVAFALSLSLLCFWWNPRMQYKFNGGHGRIVGSVEYYKMQLILLVARYLTWKLIAGDSTVLGHVQARRALHAFTLVFGFILTTLSFRAIKLDQRPLVSFQENYEPLIPAGAQQGTISAFQQPLREPNPPSRSLTQAFPIEKLAPRRQQPIYQPPTPPPEEDDDSAMEWTPEHKFDPPRTYRAPQTRPLFNEPSPFHGVIPAAPVSWAQRLRNPPNQPAFHKASEEKRENFFSKKSRRIVPDTASEVSSVAPSVADISTFEADSPVKFALPRFFAPVDHMETGLESLFSDTFSLGREPPSGAQAHNQTSMTPLASNYLPRFLAALLLGASCVAWDYASAMLLASPYSIRLTSIVMTVIILIYELVLSTSQPRTHRSPSYVVLLGFEILLVTVLARMISVRSGNEQEAGQVAALGLWFLIALTCQEVWGFISCLAAPPAALTVEAPQPPTQETQTSSSAKSAASAHPKASKANAPAASASTALSPKANPPNRVEVSQRTTRSKARIEVRRDSLGVDGLGGLSLGGW